MCVENQVDQFPTKQKACWLTTCLPGKCHYLSSHLICTHPGLRKNDHGWYHFSTADTLEHKTSNHRCSTCSLVGQAHVKMFSTERLRFTFCVCVCVSWKLTWGRRRPETWIWYPSGRVPSHDSCLQTALPEKCRQRALMYFLTFIPTGWIYRLQQGLAGPTRL